MSRDGHGDGEMMEVSSSCFFFLFSFFFGLRISLEEFNF